MQCYCKGYAVALQSICSSTATVLQQHCNRFAAALQSTCNNFAVLVSKTVKVVNRQGITRLLNTKKEVVPFPAQPLFLYYSVSLIQSP